MAFSWKNIVNALNSFRSPNQAINYILDKGAKKDPELAKSLKQMINAGEDASKVLIQLSSQGKINIHQLAQIKKYYDMARKFGFKYKIPNEVWMKAEKAIKDGQGSGQGKNKFKGF